MIHTQMEELTKLLVTPTWWISTVIVAFVVNVLAAYAKPSFDRLWATWSESRRTKLKEVEKIDEKIVQYLIADRNRLVDVRTEAIYYLLRVVLALMAGVFWSELVQNLLPNGFPGIAGYSLIYLYFTILSLQHFRKYRGLRRIIDKCRDSVYSYDEMQLKEIESLIREDEKS
jgi:hypothetical protein